MQARTLAIAGFAAVVFASDVGLMCVRRFMLRACSFGSHFGRRSVKRHCRLYGHRMPQLADDHTSHQQQDQRPALPAEFTHGARVQALAAVRNDGRSNSRSGHAKAADTASEVPEKQRQRALELGLKHHVEWEPEA